MSGTIFVGYATNGCLVSSETKQKQGIITTHWRPVCSGQDGGEEKVFSTNIPVKRTLYVFSDRKML